MRNGWRDRTVGEILQLEYGKPLAESHRATDGQFPVYGANGVKARSDRFYYDSPSIIVGRKGSAGEINLTEEKFWPLDVTYFVKYDDRQYDLRFLYHLLTTLELTTLAKGVKPGINRNVVHSLRVTVPSLPEQRNIVRILDEAFAGIATAKANTENNLRNARQLLESHLNSVFSQRGEGWVQKRLQDVCTFSSGGTPSKSNEAYWNGTIPWVSGRDMKSTRLSDSFLHISPSAVTESATRMAPAGALLILVRGMGLAHGAQITELLVPCAFNQDIRAMQVEPGVIPRYLLFASRVRINSSDNVLSNAAHGTLKIDADELKSVMIPVPPKERQAKIVATIDKLAREAENLELIYTRKLAGLEALKKSLLDRAFTGQL